MQNLVVLIDSSYQPWDVSCKAGNMCFNRFCIDEDAAYEISGVYYLKKSSKKLTDYMETTFYNSWRFFETSEKCEMIPLFYQDLFFLGKIQKIIHS